MGKKIVIIGAGPGGYVCAIRAAQLGHDVTIIDQLKNPGGTCLNFGCIPSKNLLHASYEYSKIQDHEKFGIITQSVSMNYKVLHQQKQDVIKSLSKGILSLFKKNKIRFINICASILTPTSIQIGDEVIEADAIVIATGSSPKPFPGLDVDERLILSSTGALDIENPPKTLTIVGGGYIGLELGSIWLRFGTAVTVVEVLDKITPGLDEELGNALFNELVKQGMQFKFGTTITKIQKNADDVEIFLKNASGESVVKSEKLLVSIGREANTKNLGLEKIGISLDAKGFININENFETTCKGIYAIGDVVGGAMLAHKASEEGSALADHLSGEKIQVDYYAIPSVVYTKPEVASVGFTEQELTAANIDYKVSKFPFLANSRAKAISDTIGFVKLLSDNKTGLLLGGHIIGSHAEALIGELALALNKRLTVRDIANVCRPHPTYSESIKEAGLGGYFKPIHI